MTTAVCVLSALLAALVVKNAWTAHVEGHTALALVAVAVSAAIGAGCAGLWWLAQPRPSRRTHPLASVKEKTR